MSDCSLELIKKTASRWVPRLEIGLSAEEEAEFEAWIEADPRHAAVLADQQAVWDRFGSLTAKAQSPSSESLFSAAKPLPWRVAVLSLAAAAAIVFGLFWWRGREQPEKTPVAMPMAAFPVPLEQRTLPDGSVVELNHGSEISVAFTAEFRRVKLLRGEALFTVAHNKTRPFIVSAGAIEVRAVGTAFNVRYEPAAVEVVVTKGKVLVTGPSEGASLPPFRSVLAVGQQAVVPLASVSLAPRVVSLTPEEITARLAWQPKMLDFDDQPLSAIVAKFNRLNSVHLVIRDPGLGALRLNVSFRSDNMVGFVRLLESHFGVQTEPVGAGEIALRRR